MTKTVKSAKRPIVEPYETVARCDRCGHETVIRHMDGRLVQRTRVRVCEHGCCRTSVCICHNVIATSGFGVVGSSECPCWSSGTAEFCGGPGAIS